MLLQASEKGWGATAHAAKLFAESRADLELEYERHEQLGDVVAEIGAAANNHLQVRRWVSNANRLHQNFYEDAMEAQAIAACLNDVANFVNLVRQLTGLASVDG